MAKNPYTYYKEQNLDTSSRYELVGHCFSEAALSLRRSVTLVEQSNFEEANKAIIKAQKIIAGLNGALDMRYDIAQQLHKLYQFMDKRLLKANITKDMETIKTVAGMLSELHDTWEQAVRNYKKVQA